MRKFLIKILGFGSVTLLLAIMLDMMISSGLNNTDCYRYQTYSEISKGNLKYDVLFMGNSKAFSHYNPRIIDSICGVNSYNLGMAGYPINVQIAAYHCYKSHNDPPKLIVQEADHMLTLSTINIRHQFDSERFFPMVYDKCMRKELKALGYEFLELYCPLYRYFGYQQVIKNGLLEFLRIKHFIDRPTYKGFSPFKDKWDGTNASAISSITGPLDEEALMLFEDFLDECKKDGVTVLLVNSPVYAPTTRKVKNIDDINDYYESVAQKFGCKYLNYTENYELCNDTLNFSHSIHLNSVAADRFSTDFANDLISLGLISK